MSSSIDRNLLAGIFALQHEFVTRDQLVEAMNRWVLQKDTPLEQLLPLQDDDRALLDGMLRRHLAKHQGDVEKSLRALAMPLEVREELAQVPDTDVGSSLASVPATPPQDAWPPTVPPVDGAAWPGLRFRPLHEHARGGLGVVFVAEDTDLHRDVALKEIQGDKADHPAFRAKFLLEGEITGRLEHPGVVPVYAMGKYADGRPYYAMRFIQGESLHDAIKRFHAADANPGRDPGERSLALRGLLTRFVAVCNTVAHAHAKGVLHRDLKPQNVMLGDFGETLVIDWGLAKALGRPEAVGTTATGWIQPSESTATDATRPGQVFGTPAYMPPEQARGEHDRMGFCSDVWALGAMLYAVLTGKPPYDGETALAQAQRGDIVPARQAKRSVPAALEAVCQKAMAKEPGERYAGAKEVAAEVERWLADEPVTAYRDPWRERARRWAKRNRGLVGAAAAVLLTGVVALGGGLYAVGQEQRQTANALEKAQENLKLAKDAVDKCFNVAKEDELFQQPRMEGAKKLLLKAALPFYKAISSRRPDDRELRAEEAKQLFDVGYIEAFLDQQLAAFQAYEQACEVYAKLVELYPEVSRYQQELARTHNALGNLQTVMGRGDRAFQEYRRAWVIRSRLAAAHPEVAGYQHDLASTHNNLGNLQSDLGKREEAAREYQRAREIQARLTDAHPKVAEYQQYLAMTHFNLGNLFGRQGKREEAIKNYQRGKEIYSRLVAAHPEVPRYKDELAGTHNNLGLLLRDLGKRDEALEEFVQARESKRKLLYPKSEVPRYEQELARTHNNLGLLQRDRGMHQIALDECEQALEILTRLAAAHTTTPQFQQDLAETHNNLALLRGDRGKREEALHDYRQSRDIFNKLVVAYPEVPRYQQHLATTHNNLGLLQRDLGNRGEADLEFQEARNIRSRLVAAHPGVSVYRMNLGNTLVDLGNLRRQAGKPEDALRFLAEALPHLQTAYKSEPRDRNYRLSVRNAHWSRAETLNLMKRYRDAVVDWDLVVELSAMTERSFFQLKRADCVARAGDYVRAAAEADAVSRSAKLPASWCYDLASIHALDVASAARDPARPLPQREKQAEVYARAAIYMLRWAVSTGHFRNKANLAHLQGNPDLAALRDRDDFRQFLAGLAAP